MPTIDDIPADWQSAFLQGYAKAMIWANCEILNADGTSAGSDTEVGAWLSPCDPTWALSAFDAQSQRSIREDCDAFMADNWADLDALPASYGWRDDGQPDPEYAAESAGHDFALTRNGHGAGFWDRGLGDLGERLSGAARPFGESSCYYSAEDFDAGGATVRLG